MAASSSSPPLIVDNVPTGLTEEHIKSLQIFWRKVRPNVDEHGLQIFALFFEDYPHYLKYFDFSAGEQAGAGADSNLVDNRMLQAHSIFVLSSLGNLIQYALKDDLLLTCSLTRVHKKHIGRNIKQKDVMIFAGSVVKYLTGVLGADMTPNLTEALVLLMTRLSLVFDKE